MDPVRIAVRCLFAYVTLLVFVRLSGKRTVKQGSPFDFAVALILGDKTDDLMWGEVGAAQFTVATGMLVLIHSLLDAVRFRAGWLR